MDQRADDLGGRRDRVRFQETTVSGSSSTDDTEEVFAGSAETSRDASRDASGVDVVEPDDIERTRAHMSDTIEQIQERLTPERVEDTAKEVTEDVKEAVIEAVDHAIQEGRTTAEDFSEIARVAALETVEHAVEQMKAALPTVTDQARELAQQTIDHAILEAKSAIRELSGQARSAAREATIGKVEHMAQTTSDSTKSFSTTLMTRIKQNPGPAALTGLGIGWLMMSGKGGGSYGQASSENDKTVKEMTAGVSSQGYDSSSSAKDKAGDAVDTAKGKAGDVADTAKDAASTVTDQTKQAASTVSEQAKQVPDQVTSQVQQFSARFRQTLQEKPLTVGLVAAAVGSAAALAVPVTQKEHQILGESRDKLIDKAQVGAQDLVEKVQKVAGEAGEAAEKEAKYQGLAPEE